MSIAFLFPGQGSQQVGMGSKLYQNEPASRAVFDQADDLLGFPLSDLCFNGPDEELTDTVNQQPALFVNSIATLRAMEDHGTPMADYVAGHSLGEFSALVACGSLNFDDGLALVQHRGTLMKKAGQDKPGAMAAILGLDVSEAREICRQAQNKTGQPLQIANDNCPGQVVISGNGESLEEAIQMAADARARKIIRLPISIAAHSPLMKSAAESFSIILDETPIAPPKVPIIGNVSASPLETPEEIKEDLKKQLTSPVMWTDSMEHLLKRGVDTFYEIGTGSVLLGLLKRIDRQATRVKWDSPF
ncbi:MAG: ACP S-malonyltransferase [Anaerolineae bacterium]|nr:MAG: ACP S-malonyltransferase [Anaerolineae bacterium]